MPGRHPNNLQSTPCIPLSFLRPVGHAISHSSPCPAGLLTVLQMSHNVCMLHDACMCTCACTFSAASSAFAAASLAASASAAAWGAMHEHTPTTHKPRHLLGCCICCFSLLLLLHHWAVSHLAFTHCALFEPSQQPSLLPLLPLPQPDANHANKHTIAEGYDSTFSASAASVASCLSCTNATSDISHLSTLTTIPAFPTPSQLFSPWQRCPLLLLLQLLQQLKLLHPLHKAGITHLNHCSPIHRPHP